MAWAAYCCGALRREAQRHRALSQYAPNPLKSRGPVKGRLIQTDSLPAPGRPGGGEKLEGVAAGPTAPCAALSRGRLRRVMIGPASSLPECDPEQSTPPPKPLREWSMTRRCFPPSWDHLSE